MHLFRIYPWVIRRPRTHYRMGRRLLQVRDGTTINGPAEQLTGESSSFLVSPVANQKILSVNAQLVNPKQYLGILSGVSCNGISNVE